MEDKEAFKLATDLVANFIENQEIPPGACGQPVDARGISRPQGPGCEIGAAEVEVGAERRQLLTYLRRVQPERCLIAEARGRRPSSVEPSGS